MNSPLRHFVFVPAIFFAASVDFCEGTETFTPPPSPRAVFNFNPGWKFYKGDVTNAERVDFDDSRWTDVSAPHTFNDVDSYQQIISHGGGDRGAWSGVVWYRKHFKLPAGAKDGKVFLELEGLKQADGRQDSSEVCRVSGKADSVRLPKETYYVYRVMQNPVDRLKPGLHAFGLRRTGAAMVAAGRCGRTFP